MKPQKHKADLEELQRSPTIQLIPEVPVQMEDITLNVGAMNKIQAEKPQLKVIKELPAALQALIDNGIPLRKAVFHRAVIFDCHGGTPETAYYSKEWATDVKAHKVAQMWYTPHGLVCTQKDIWKIIPLANVSDTCL